MAHGSTRQDLENLTSTGVDHVVEEESSTGTDVRDEDTSDSSADGSSSSSWKPMMERWWHFPQIEHRMFQSTSVSKPIRRESWMSSRKSSPGTYHKFNVLDDEFDANDYARHQCLCHLQLSDCNDSAASTSDSRWMTCKLLMHWRLMLPSYPQTVRTIKVWQSSEWSLLSSNKLSFSMVGYGAQGFQCLAQCIRKSFAPFQEGSERWRQTESAKISISSWLIICKQYCRQLWTFQWQFGSEIYTKF